MRQEPDVYAIDTDDGAEVFSVNLEDGFGREFSTNYDGMAEAAVVPRKPGAARQEDRKSPRYPVPEARQACELRVGADLLPALLIDESSGGFAILISDLEGLKPGKRIRLHTDMGWYKVRVVYVNRAAHPTHSDPDCECWFRLGLRKARSFRLF